MADSIDEITKSDKQNSNLLFYNFNAGCDKQESYTTMQRPSGRNDYSRESHKKYFNHQLNEIDQESYKEISTVRTS